MPDYDGLPEQGDDAGDVLLWTARILTGPLYLVSEYVIRQPLGWAIVEGERLEVIDHLIDFFTFGPDDNIAVFPTFFYEFGFQPSVGLYARWDEFLFPENTISTHAAFGGTDWLSYRLTDRIVADDRWEIGAQFLARRRPDFFFEGIGPDQTHTPRARFGADRIEVSFWNDVRYWQSSDVGFELGYRSISFDDHGWADDPSVGFRARALNEERPYGFDTGYEATSVQLRADVDTRTPRAPPEGGLQVAVHAGQHGAFGGLPNIERWFSWGGSTTLATDVLGQHRVIGVTAEAHFVTPIDGSRLPFTELIDAGGAGGLLPGYQPGRILGESAVGAKLHYTWPIWAFLDARLYVGTANAFGRHLEDFDFDLLRMSFGLAFVPRIPDTDLPFELDFAFATETFERDATIESFRLAVGARDVL